MTDWFRGVIEAAYVGTPAKPRANTPLDLAPYDIKLYRGTVNALERIPAPTDDDVSGLGTPAAAAAAAAAAAPADAPATPTQSPATKDSAGDAKRALRQAELLDVQFLGVGAEDARDEHAAYDLRITDIRLLGRTESGDQIYGRLTGTVVACLTPSTSMKRAAEQKQARSVRRNQQLGTWLEGLRWVMVITAAWMAFGTCGSAVGGLWLGVVLPAAFFRLITKDMLTPTHGVRVFGWAMVFACGSLGGLMFYRVTHLECYSALWWIIGMIVAVFVTSLLPSRYPFFWSKAILAGSVLPLCSLHGTTCKTEHSLPSVISQGPRTDPDGHWPRQPAEPTPAAASGPTQ